MVIIRNVIVLGKRDLIFFDFIAEQRGISKLILTNKASLARRIGTTLVARVGGIRNTDIFVDEGVAGIALIDIIVGKDSVVSNSDAGRLERGANDTLRVKKARNLPSA